MKMCVLITRLALALTITTLSFVVLSSTIGQTVVWAQESDPKPEGSVNESNLPESATSLTSTVRVTAEIDSVQVFSSVEVPSNDTLTAATMITIPEFVETIDTTGATVSSDDPSPECGNRSRYKSVWYKLIPVRSMQIEINTFGSNYDTILSMYRQAPNLLSSVACNDDYNGNQSLISALLQSGSTYYVMVSSYSGGGGQLHISAHTQEIQTIDVPLDIVLVQDETGSMGNDIAAVNRLTPEIWASLDIIAKAGFRMSVVGFRDYAMTPWGNGGDWVYRLVGDFTTDPIAFRANISRLTANGGNDTPESQFAALHYLFSPGAPCIDSNRNGSCLDTNDTLPGQQPTFRTGARRVILFATDADFHEPDTTIGYPGPNRESVVQLIQANRAIIIGLVPGGSGRLPQLDELTELTGGSTQNTGSTGGDVALAIARALSSVRTVSPQLSTIEAIPTTLPVDGAVATITVTLRDTGNNPVAGRVVLVHSDGSALVHEPNNITDAGGHVTATIASIIPQVVNINAVDATDGIQIEDTIQITFTGVTISPNENLQQSLAMLNRYTNSTLDSIGRYAQEAGVHKDQFQVDTYEDRATLWLNRLLFIPGAISTLNQAARPAVQLSLPGVLDNGWSALLNPLEDYPYAQELFHSYLAQSIRDNQWSRVSRPILQGGLKYLAARARDEAITDYLPGLVTDTLAWFLGGQGSGISGGNWIASDLSDMRQVLAEGYDRIRAGIPLMSNSEQEEYANELKKRTGATLRLLFIEEQEAFLLDNLRQSHDSFQTDSLLYFTLKFSGSALSHAFFPGAGLGYDAIVTVFEDRLTQIQIDQATMGYDQSIASLKRIPQVGVQIYSNELQGWERIMRLKPPMPVTAQIDRIVQVSEGSLIAWLYWSERASYQEVTITNTSDEGATFYLLSQYGYDSTLLGLPLVYMAMTQHVEVEIGPHETQTVRIPYKNNEKGGSPTQNSRVYVYVLGANDTGLFYADQAVDVWDPTRRSTDGEIVVAAANADIDVIENPLDLYVFVDDAPYTYEGQLWVSNPFTTVIEANINQPLPDGAVLLSGNGGALLGNVISWTVAIEARDVISIPFTFKVGDELGLPNKLIVPAATMSFSGITPGIVISTTSNPGAVLAFHPITVQVFGVKVISNTAVTLPVTLTNQTTATVGTTIFIEIADAKGNILYAAEQSTTLAGKTTQAVLFNVPSGLPGGGHTLTVWLSFGNARNLVGQDIFDVIGLAPESPASLVIEAKKATLVADDNDDCILNVSVSDIHGTPVYLETITFTSSIGRVSPTAITGFNGVAVATLTSGTQIGVATVTATAGTVSGSTTVNFIAGPPAAVTVTPAPATILADGASTSAIQATVKDAFSNPVANQVVNFTANLGGITAQATTNTDGIASATLTSGTQIGIATVTATAGAASSTTTVTFVAGAATTVTLAPTPGTILADGASTSAINIEVRDAFGNPVANQVVNFSTNLGGITAQVITDGNGKATVTLTSAAQVGIATITATAGAANGSTIVIFIGNAITGLVFVDMNLNGIRDDGESGIAGATISIVREGSATAVTLVSDETGGVAFAALPGGVYKMSVTPPHGFSATTATEFTLTLGADGINAPAVGVIALNYLPLLMRN